MTMEKISKKYSAMLNIYKRRAKDNKSKNKSDNLLSQMAERTALLNQKE